MTRHQKVWLTTAVLVVIAALVGWFRLWERIG